MGATGSEGAGSGGAHGGSDGGAAGQEGHAHVSDRTYVIIAAVLAVLTAMEVMVFYVEALAPLLLPILMVLMVAKFVLVVMFFMHLKFDSKVLAAVFGWGLVTAVGVIFALMAIFGKFSGGGAG